MPLSTAQCLCLFSHDSLHLNGFVSFHSRPDGGPKSPTSGWREGGDSGKCIAIEVTLAGRYLVKEKKRQCSVS
jgi:hypothetical protein